MHQEALNHPVGLEEERVGNAANCSSRGHRKIAASGALFHAVNAGGITTRAWYSRAALEGKRMFLVLGENEHKARELDHTARTMLRAGIASAEVKNWIAGQLAVERTCRRPDSRPAVRQPPKTAIRK